MVGQELSPANQFLHTCPRKSPPPGLPSADRHTAAPTTPIHERDIAAVAVHALCDDGHAGFEQISTIADVIGRSLRIEEISPEDAKKG